MFEEKKMNEIKNHWKKWMYWFVLAVAIIIVYKALGNLGDIWSTLGKFFDVLKPFFAGVFLAYLLYIPCKKVEELYKKSKIKLVHKKARSMSIATVFLITLVLIIIIMNFIVPVIITSITELVTNLQGYYEITISHYNELPEESFLKSEYMKEIISNVQNIDLKQYINLDNIAQYAKNAIDAATSVFNIFVTIIVSIYVLAERGQILDFIKRFTSVTFKEKTNKNLGKYFNNTNDIFFKFISAQFLDAIVVGILATIAMSIMKVQYAPLLGFIIGLFNIIPYFGAIIAIAISGIITIITGGLSKAVWMIIVVTILQQVDANIINPKIIGGSLKVSPLLVIFSITVGGAYFGVMGMFLAVPVIAVIKILVEDYIKFKSENK
jgi:predicted PurR-regulated permease PerM